MWKIITDAVPQMIAAGIKYTIPIALVSFAIGLIIALVTALTRISAYPASSSRVFSRMVSS